MSNQRFGWLQLKILHVLWEKGRANARDITEIMNIYEPIAHSTVQTILRRMERKGAVAHETENRTFLYYPKVNPEQVAKSSLQEIIDFMFFGAPEGLVSYLIKYEYISPAKLIEIRKLIDEQEK